MQEGLIECMELMRCLPTTEPPTPTVIIDSTKRTFNEESLVDSIDSIKIPLGKQSVDSLFANESPMCVLDHAEASIATCESNLGHNNTDMHYRRVYGCCKGDGTTTHDGYPIGLSSCVPLLTSSMVSITSSSKRRIDFEAIGRDKADGSLSGCSLIQSSSLTLDRRSMQPPLMHSL